MCSNLVQCKMFLTLLYTWDGTSSLKFEFSRKKEAKFTLEETIKAQQRSRGKV